MFGKDYKKKYENAQCKLERHQELLKDSRKCLGKLDSTNINLIQKLEILAKRTGTANSQSEFRDIMHCASTRMAYRCPDERETLFKNGISRSLSIDYDKIKRSKEYHNELTQRILQQIGDNKDNKQDHRNEIQYLKDQFYLKDNEIDKLKREIRVLKEVTPNGEQLKTIEGLENTIKVNAETHQKMYNEQAKKIKELEDLIKYMYNQAIKQFGEEIKDVRL
jgi:hypothetical protein